MAEAEAIARALEDPVILSRTLQTRAAHASSAGRVDVVGGFADEALHWARAAGDDLVIALAAFSHALAAKDAAELRARVRRAASLLEAAGDVYHLATLFASAAYAALCNGSDRDAHEFVGRAIPLTHELDNPYGWMLLQGNIGLANLMTGDADAARAAFREELRLCSDLRVLHFASEGLLGLAAVAAAHNDHDRAVRLLGAADAQTYGSQQDKSRPGSTPARKHHGTDVWDAAVRHGAALSFESAIAYALEEPARSTNASLR